MEKKAGSGNVCEYFIKINTPEVIPPQQVKSRLKYFMIWHIADVHFIQQYYYLLILLCCNMIVSSKCWSCLFITPNEVYHIVIGKQVNYN